MGGRGTCDRHTRGRCRLRKANYCENTMRFVGENPTRNQGRLSARNRNTPDIGYCPRPVGSVRSGPSPPPAAYASAAALLRRPTDLPENDVLPFVSLRT